MNKYIEALKNQRNKFLEITEKYNKQKAELKQKLDNDLITNTVWTEELKVIKDNYQNEKQSTLSMLETLKNDFITFIASVSTIDSKYIDDDVKLLSDAFNLTQEELQALSDKHYHNYTMQRAIGNYLKERNIYLDNVPPTPDERISAFCDLIDIFVKGVNGDDDGYFRQYMSKDEYLTDFFESKELSDIDQLTGYAA